MAAKRTTHRSTAGRKLYAKRDKAGRFKDVQSYKRAHGQDVRRKSKAEAGTLAWAVYRKGVLVAIELASADARLYVYATVRRVRVTPV